MINAFKINYNLLPYFSSDNIVYPHGFSTREGGVSHGNGLDTLDLGAGDDADVNENRRRFASALGSDISCLFSAKQIHSANIVTVTEADKGGYFECDGFVTKEKGLLLSVKVADCVPILLSDEENGVIAAVHAGWRGTAAGIAANAVKEMVKLGAIAENIQAAIGPSIHPCCYEVDLPFLNAIRRTERADILLPFITPSRVVGKFFADLQGMNCAFLTDVGVNEDNISVCDICTCCEKDSFFSHRGSGGKRGLMMAAIMME